MKAATYTLMPGDPADARALRGKEMPVHCHMHRCHLHTHHPLNKCQMRSAG